MAAWELYRL